MSERFAGRSVVVTGGASGIGAATVRRFHSEGAFVFIADVQDSLAHALADDLGDRATAVHCDVTDEESVAALTAAALSRTGRLDVFYANAGVMGALGPISRLRTPDIDATLAVNLRGVILSFKHAAAAMVPQRGGVLLATASPAAVVGGVGPHVYSATKAGIIGLVQSVAAELRPAAIRANAIVPGAIVSAMTADILTGDASDLSGARAALGPAGLVDRPGVPEDIAAAAAFLASDDATFVTGSTFYVDAGYSNAPGDSPFATGDWADPAGMFEAGRHS